MVVTQPSPDESPPVPALAVDSTEEESEEPVAMLAKVDVAAAPAASDEKDDEANQQ